MAHLNMTERRIKVAEMVSMGFSKRKIIKDCCLQFGCSFGTIYSDLYEIGFLSKKNPDISGIYGIKCLDGLYIGSSKNIKKRCVTHKQQLVSGIHYCKNLQTAYIKSGGAVEFYTICECAGDLIGEEMNQIIAHRNHGYNIYNTYPLIKP